MYADKSYIGDLNSNTAFPKYGSLWIERDLNESSLSFTFEVGSGEAATVEVRRGPRLLTVSLMIPSVFRGNIRGLMGTFNGTPDSDLVNRDGKALASNATEKQVIASSRNRLYVQIQAHIRSHDKSFWKSKYK